MTKEQASAGWARRAYGVDVAAGRVVVVCARRTGRGLRIVPVPCDASHPLRPGPGDAVAVAMPPRESLAMWVRAPFRSLRKARRVFPTLLDIQLPFPLDSCLHRFVGVARGATPSPSGVDALGVAVRQSDLDTRLARLAEHGIDPHVVDLAGVALWTGSYDAVPAAPVETDRVIVSLAGDATVVAGQAGRYGGVQSVAAADPMAIDRFLSAQLGSDWRRRADSPGRLCWLWCGPDAADDACVRALTEALALPATVAVTTAEVPETFLARALATRALKSGPLRCNLRHGDREHPAVTRRLTGRVAMAAAVVLVAGLALAGVGTWARHTSDRRLMAIRKAFEARASDLMGYPVTARGADAVRLVEREVERRVVAMRPFQEMFAPSLLTTLVDVAREVGLAGGAIRALTVSREELVVTVRAPSEAVLSAVEGRLSGAGYAVRPSGAVRVDEEGGVTRLFARGVAGGGVR